MREITPERIWEELARDRGEAAITDLDLYNEIFQEHYIQEFEEFCRRSGFQQLLAPTQEQEFVLSSYVRKQELRREALNLFIQQKPHVVMHGERSFIMTFLSEIEIRVDEITLAELVEFTNEVMAHRSGLETLKLWHRTRRLRQKLKSLVQSPGMPPN